MAHQRPHFPLRTINVLNICVCEAVMEDAHDGELLEDALWYGYSPRLTPVRADTQVFSLQAVILKHL